MRPPTRLQRFLLLFLLLLPLALALAATEQPEAEEALLVAADRWGPISTPMPSAAVERFEAAVVGYASLQGQMVEPLEEVRPSLCLFTHGSTAAMCL